jgi:hypothetical protein
VRVIIEVRHVPRFRVMDYLVQAGGTPTDILEVAGDGWTASLEALEPDHLGIVAIPRDRLVIEGDPLHVERVSAFMRRHVTRRD